MNTTTIYGLIDPRDERIRYIGKAIDPNKRFANHLCQKGKTHKHCWISGLKTIGMKPKMIILDIVSDNQWKEFEKLWITGLRKEFNLVNLTDGGDGLNGYKATEETKRKMSVAHKGKRLPSLSDDRKARMSASLRSTFSSAEAKRRLSAGQYRRYENEDERRKTSEVQKGKRRAPLTDEHKKKISFRLKGRKFTEEHLRNLRIGISLHDKAKNDIRLSFGYRCE